MTLKVLILLYMFFRPGQFREAINENYLNLGPSAIHSIKGAFYEEKQKRVILNPREPILENNNNGDPRQLKITSDVPKILKVIQGNSNPLDSGKTESDKSVIDNHEHNPSVGEPINTHFHSENVVSNYEKNNTVETIKKELAFDSLLIKNNLSDMDMPETPTNVMNSYKSDENNIEADTHNTSMGVEDSNRRLSNKVYYQPIPSTISIPPSVSDNNFIPITHRIFPINYGSNRPLRINSDAMLPLRQNKYDGDKSDNRICDDKESNEAFDRSGNVVEFDEPTNGSGISNAVRSRMMLMDHPRVCYACSSINDPSCWSPSRRTAVKYCRADHASCLTNLYKYKGLSYVIRNCGSVCEQAAEGPTRYTSCTICHHDLCNSAYLQKIHNITMFMFLIFQLLFVLNKSNSL